MASKSGQSGSVQQLHFQEVNAHRGVMDPNTADDAKRPDNLVGRPQSRAEADDFNDNISPSFLCHLLDPFQDAFLAVGNIEWLGSQTLCGSKTALHGVNGKEVLWHVLKCRNDGAQPNGSAADDHHCGFCRVLGSEPGEPATRAEKAGGKHVCHENEGIVAYFRGRYQYCAVGQRHPYVFCLTARQTFGAEDQAADTPG